MTLEYNADQFGRICGLLHQAVCEQALEPDFSEEALGFTGPVERAFTTAILEDVLGMRWGLKCPDCQGYDPEDYIVTAEVWAAAGLEPDSGWFHLACLEKRLGRHLIEADFPADVPANDWQPWEPPMMRACITPGCPNRIPILPDRKTPSRCNQCRGRSWSNPPPANLYAYGSGWAAIRKRVLERDGHACQLRYRGCLGKATQVDHIVQPEAGGTDDLENLRAVCRKCHARRTGQQGALAKQRRQRR